MALRLNGLMSGIDTESIIQQLVEARRTKVTTAKKAQMKVDYKLNAWKSLNTKLQNLQTKYLSNMRFSDAYTKKTTKVSNSSVVSVLTGDSAVLGTQSLKVKQMAKTGILTGGRLSENGSVTALTKLGVLDEGFTGGTINIKSGSKSVDIKLTADSTISDVLTQARNAGLNASFDANQQRIFISSKESGEANDFSITAVDEGGAAALSALKLNTDLSQDKAALKQYQEYAGYYVAGSRADTLANMKTLIDADVASRTASYLEQYKSLKASADNAQKSIDDILEQHKDWSSKPEDWADLKEQKNAEIEELQAKLEDETLSAEDREKYEDDLAKLQSEVSDLNKLESQNKTLSDLNTQINKVEEYVTITSEEVDGETVYTATAKEDTLVKEVEDYYYNKAEYAAKAIEESKTKSDGTASTDGATKVSGQDAIILLNDAEFRSANNVFEINGLTFTVMGETKPDETVTVTTERDTAGIYDMVKNFLKEYNAIINEIDKLYNADLAKGYEPLTSEEKEAMSETEIKEWEEKIKESILRRDENLNSVGTALKSVMSSGFEINGKTYHLFDFGIETLGYFSSADNEKNAYHINGDPDDDSTSNKMDKLMNMITNDPDTVVSFFTKLSQTLYGKMSDLSKSVQGYRSFGNFYDDKKIQADYDSYTSKIAQLEEKLNDYEDSWYAKFAKMETAMAKLQQNTSAITSLLGG